MKNRTQTLQKIVRYINNSDEDGGFWLPNIQRPFVWTEDQICKLFDSILREYPISTLLVWKTTSPIRRRKFVDNWKSTYQDHLSSFYVPEDRNRKCLVLDGQQRLQSLYIGLCGSYEGKELCFDVLSGVSSLPDDVKYRFEFMKGGEVSFPYVRFKDMVFSNIRRREFLESLKQSADFELTKEESERLEDNYDAVERAFKTEESIVYQELDSLDNPNLYSEDDVVEIFIRANSGGTKLEKSDLLFSLLNATWDAADNRMEELLDDLNGQGFAFDRDFVLKTCLVLLDLGAQYDVSKFRKEGTRKLIEAEWDKLSGSIRTVADFVKAKTYIHGDKALPSYLALIPLVYVAHHFPRSWSVATGVEEFLVRTLLTGAFSGQSDRMLDSLVNKFKDAQRFDANAGYGAIRDQNRSLDITKDRFFEMGYGSKNIHLIFNLWYPSFTHVPTYDNNLPQIDHIFPQSLLKNLKVVDLQTGRQRARYSKNEINQLANCMLLTRAENGAGGKGDTPPDAWFKDKTPEYLSLHLIPEDPSLWNSDRFEDFIEERKKLIAAKFSDLIN